MNAKKAVTAPLPNRHVFKSDPAHFESPPARRYSYLLYQTAADCRATPGMSFVKSRARFEQLFWPNPGERRLPTTRMYVCMYSGVHIKVDFFKLDFWQMFEF